MEMIEIIKVLRWNGLPIRVIAKVTDIPKSSVHRILSKLTDITPRENEPDEYEGLKFYFVHLPYTFFCPECGLEQNHTFVCADCGMLIPAECGEEDTCSEGFHLRELKWGNDETCDFGKAACLRLP